MNRIILITSAALLLLWGCGTTNSLDDEQPNPPADVTYEADIQPLMYNYCTTCHGGPVSSAGLRLTTYQEVRSIAEGGQLVQRVNDTTTPMPPSGLLSAQEQELITQWVENGFPEN